MKGYSRIHGIAHCSDCSWQNEDYINILNEVKKHYKETGHEIHIELGFCRIIKRKEMKE